MKKRVIALVLAGTMGLSMIAPSISAEAAGTMYMVSSSHLDTVWSWDLEQTIGEFIPNTFTENFDLIEKYPDYQFNFEGAYRYQLLEEYYPELYEKLKGYIDSGNWNVAGSALENGDVNVPSPEALFRNILYGNNYFEDSFGVRSKDIFLPDCFGFGYALPSIAAHSNLLGFSTQKLSWGNTFPNGQLPFDFGLWKGPDGKSIIANINYNSYVSLYPDGVRTNEDLLNRLQRSPVGYISALYGKGGDRGGGVPESTVAAISREMAANQTSSLQAQVTGTDTANPIQVLFASTDDMFKNMTAAERAALSTYDGELLMKVHGTGCYTSRAISKRWNRRGELLGAAAEQAGVASDWLGSSEYPTGKMEEIWTRIIAHQFHDDITGTSNSAIYQRSWNDYMVAIKQFASEYESGVAGVAASMDTRVSAGVPLVVNNPVAADRADVVEADVILDSAQPYVRVYDDLGKEVPSQVLSHVGKVYKIAFAAEVKSLGYRTYKVVPSDTACALQTGMSVGSNRLSNDRYLVTVDGNGDISSVYDKQLNQELLSKPIRLALFDESSVYWAAWELSMDDYAFQTGDAYVTAAPKITVVENGPARVALKVERTYGGSTYSQTVSLGAGSQVVKVDNLVNWNEKAKLLKAEFNLAASNPNATYDIGLGTVQRGNNTSDKSEVPVQKWADLTNTDSSFGVSILNDCKYGMDKYDNDTLRLTLIHTPKNDYSHDTDVFGSAGEYGAAGQNVQEVGENRFAYGIYGHSGTASDSDVQIEAESFNQPMNAFQTVSHAGSLGSDYSFGSLNNDKVLVRALKKAERSDEVVIRVNEGSGEAQNGVTLSLGSGIKSAREIYASEESVGPATVQNGKLTFDIGAFGVKTFAVTLKDSGIAANSNPSAAVSLPYNADAYSGNAKKADGGINLIGDCYPSELLSDTVESAGVQYTLGSRKDGDKNAVRASGQTISLPAGYTTLKLLAASANGDREATFKVGDKPVSLTIGDYSENIATWDLRNLGVTGYVKEQTPALVATHRHTNGKDNIAATTYMFSYSLDITGASTITLPIDSNIILFAATAVNDAGTKLTTASNLYDQRARTENLPAGGISTGFETGDPAVTTNYTTNSNGINEGICDITTERAESGSRSLKISGTDNSSDKSFVYYTLSTDPILVVPGTILSYSFYAGNDLGRYTAVDMEFSGGSPLRDRSAAVDADGVQMHPARGHGEVGKWVTVTCDLYKYAPGETITKLMLAYDHGEDTGNFSAYVDNLFIGVNGDVLTGLLEKAGRIDRGLYTDASLQTFDSALSLTNQVLASESPSQIEKTYVTGELEKALDGLVLRRDAYEDILAWEYNEKIPGAIVTDTDSSGNPTNIGGVSGGSWALYKGLQFGNRGADSVTINYSGWKTGTDPVVEVRLGSRTGELLGEISVPQTSNMDGGVDWSKYQLATASLSKVLTGEQDICLVFKSDSGGHVCNAASFTFTSAPPKAALTQAYQQAQKVNRAGLPDEKLEALDGAIAEAEKILADSSASQEEIDAAFVALQEAISGLPILDASSGDVNGDQKVDASDVVALRAVIASGNQPTAEQLAAGDLNQDGLLTSDDVSLLLEQLDILPGDVSGDNELTALDIMSMRKAMLADTALTDRQLAAGDLSGDGAFSALDIMQLRKLLLQKA